MWFLARMRADVSRLMFETMEGSITQRTLVRSGEVLSRFGLSGVGVGVGGHHGHRRGHGVW